MKFGLRSSRLLGLVAAPVFAALALGSTAAGNTPAEFRKQIEEDLARYKEVVASANIKAD